jgi:PqqD family protein of HPr-rel-A system
MWRLTPGQTLCAQQFGDEFVLFNDFSGATHLLGAGAIALLDLLRQGPSPSSELHSALAAALGCAHDSAFDAEADELLARLAGLHLVEQTAC